MPRLQEIYNLLDKQNYVDLTSLLQEEFIFTNEDELEVLEDVFATLLSDDSIDNELKSSFAQSIISRIDMNLLDNESHVRLTWGVANPRGDGGINDPSFIALKSMISVGFNINYAKKGGGDLFSEVAKQAVGSCIDTDAELIKLILRTGEVRGFEGRLANQVIQDLENPNFTKAVLLHLRKTEKGFNYDQNLYRNRHQIYYEWRPYVAEIEPNKPITDGLGGAAVHLIQTKKPANFKKVGVASNSPAEIGTLHNATQLVNPAQKNTRGCTIS
jgi:hypothetical protein